MKKYQIQELVGIARNKSPFYQNLYKNIETSNVSLTDLPIINEDEFWKANSYHNNRIITEPSMHGILLRSGGTTGAPKTSLFSSDEWRTFCQIMCLKLQEAKFIKANDRIANLFFAGPLYGSLIFINDMLNECRLPILNLPIGMGSEIKDTVTLIKELQSNVLMSSPFFLVMVAYFVKTQKIKGIHMDRLLYGGDVMLESQYHFVKNVFPHAVISSSGYAGTDGGFLGYADSTCQLNEYRTDPEYTVMEILDEHTGEAIEAEDRKGKLIVTNMTKTLMPVIRYPVGDLAVWREPMERKYRKLKLVGRHTKKDDLLLLGKRELAYQDFDEILKKSRFYNYVLGFQIISNKKTTLQIASEPDVMDTELAEKEIKGHFFDSNPDIETQFFNIEFIDFYDLKFNTRTYKSIRVIKE